MHICLITSSRPFEVTFGGEEKFTVSLGKWLLNRGNNVIIVGRKLFGVQVATGYFDEANVESMVKHDQPRLLHLPYAIFAFSMLVTSMLFVLRVLAINRKTRISVIHAQDTGYGGLSAILLAKMIRVPVVVSSHGLRYRTLSNTSDVSARLLLPWEYWLDVFTSKHADLVINVSSPGREFFAKIGVKKSKMRLIPIAVRIGNFAASEEVRRAARKEFRVQNDVLVGFIGRLSAEKNLFTLLEAFAKALRHVEEMRLILVGAGPEEERLKMLSNDRGINDQVIFTGIRHDIDRVLSALDIFTLPSFTEGCPTSLLEALASGKAIVASDIPSIRDIVSNGKEAILVNPCNAEELAKDIVLLYNNPDLRSKLGLKAREKAKLYDVDSVYGKILSEYRNLLTSRGMN